MVLPRLRTALSLSLTIGAVITSPCLASAATPDAGPSDASSSGSSTTAEDANAPPANCPSAVARQKRLSEAAALRRMQRAAKIATKETIAMAEHLTATWWEQQGVAFVVDSTRRGKAYLERSVRTYRAQVEEVSQATCRALAAREQAACQALPEHETHGCLAWLALEAATQPGADCGTAPEALRAACAVVTTPTAPCPAEDGQARTACERVRAARAGLAEACKHPDGETRCTWAGLLSSLALPDAATRCDALRPGGDRRSPRAKRTHSLCVAVVRGDAARCPSDTAATQVDDVATWLESRVIAGTSGLRLVTNLQVDRPAVCAVEVEVRQGEQVAETIRWIASPGSRASVPDWRDLSASGSPWEVSAVATAACVPRAYWGRP